MPRNETPIVPFRTRAWCFLRLGYTELQYWLIGLTQESYHLKQANAWVEMHGYRRAIAHMKGYLANTENATVRWYLAYYYSCVEEWAQSAQEYAKAALVLPKPAVRLGQAEAELRLGNRTKATEIIDALDREFPQLEDVLRNARDALRNEIQLGT